MTTYISRLWTPRQGEVLPDGEVGEIVITTLEKGRCSPDSLPHSRPVQNRAGRLSLRFALSQNRHPIGRTDDMVKVKGVNIFPSQIEELLSSIEGASSEYQVMVDHLMGKDVLTLFVETNPSINKYALEIEIQNQFKGRIGLTPVVKLVELGELPRSEKKSTRVFDNRY